MNESNWWSSHIKPRWHVPSDGHVAWKVQDAFNGGLPDVDVCFNGVAAKIELKYDAEWPKREDTKLWFSTLDKANKTRSIVSATQWNHLTQWRLGGGLAFVLIGVARTWILLEQGSYENIPMTRAQLLASCVRCDLLSGYPSLATIPAFLEEVYGRQE